MAKLKAATGLSVVSSNKTRLSKFKFYETPLKNQFKQNEPETGAFAHSMLNRHIPKARHATTPTQSGAAVVPSVVRGQKIVPMVVFKLAQTSSLSFTSLMNLQPSVHMDKELVPPKDGSIMKDSQRQQMQTMLRDTIKDPAASLAKLSKGKNNDTSDIANFEVYGAQINPKKTPFINFKYVLNSGTRPASLVVFVRSNMVKYAVSLWNEKLLTQRCVPRPVPVDRPHSWSCAAGARLSASRSCRSSPRAVVQQLRAEREPPAPKSSSHRQLQWKGDDRSERVARQRCGG